MSFRRLQIIAVYLLLAIFAAVGQSPTEDFKSLGTRGADQVLIAEVDSDDEKAESESDDDFGERMALLAIRTCDLVAANRGLHSLARPAESRRKIHSRDPPASRS